MATLPRATVRVEPTATAPGGGDNLICLLAPVASGADMQPTLFGSATDLVAEHGYSEGAEYAALHITQTGLPVLFVPMPIGTAGAISRYTSFGNSGSSVVSVAAGVAGVLAEHDGVLRVVAGGTIGTSQIKLELSLDGGRSFQQLRLGTASSSVLPNVSVTASFGAGTLVTGDTIAEWHGSGPRISTADLAAVRTALAAQVRFFRSWLLCGDVPDDTSAEAMITQVNAYASSNDRFTFARVSAPDRLPLASLSQSYGRMTGAPALTFAEVGASGDTITRAAGSWLADGFVAGDTITVTGTASNNITGAIASLSATVITLGTTDLVAEVTSAATVVGAPTLTFAEVGATGDTITRSRGSWLVDGFRDGDTITVDGTVSNDVNGTVSTVTATVLTLGSTDLAAEALASSGVTVVGGETKSAWMARLDAEFGDVDAEARLDISAGRGAIISPYSGWKRRIPAGWYASLREYQHDLHVATWRKDLGPVGADLFDADNELVEWDERVDGPAGVSARFTTLRTWANGPRGAFVCQSLTRAGDGQIMSQTHNAAVVNAACNVVQQSTENVIGRSLLLNDDGTATADALAVIASEVNADLQLAILSSRGEGPRASAALWTPSPDDVYNVPEPVMHGTLDINLNGTIHSVATVVRVRSAGQ